MPAANETLLPRDKAKRDPKHPAPVGQHPQQLALKRAVTQVGRAVGDGELQPVRGDDVPSVS